MAKNNGNWEGEEHRQGCTSRERAWCAASAFSVEQPAPVSSGEECLGIEKYSIDKDLEK